MAAPHGGIEILKRDPDEFGGIQFAQLLPEEVAQRVCAAKWCRWGGRVQMQIAGEQPASYRVWCGAHYVKMQIAMSLAVGDPSPIEQARQIADKMDVNWRLVESLRVKGISNPREFACINCGGGMDEERQGMYAGIRFVHTCEKA